MSFARQERGNNKGRNPKGFAAVGGFLFYFLPSKSEEAETDKSSRETPIFLNQN